MLNKKSGSLCFLVLIYAASFLVGMWVYRMLAHSMSGLWPMMAADVAGTLVVWFSGLCVKNASAYDPYWSVAPAVMAGGWMLIFGHMGVVQLMLLAALVIWGVRLTANFIDGWPGFSHQDWRYGMLKNKSPKLWWATNLFGINMFPTLIVFACMVPAFFVVKSGRGVSALSVVGLILCIVAVFLQMTADAEMREFRRNKKSGAHIEAGLWRFSRHPNYFGEVIFWWGVWVMQMGAVPEIWMTVFAPAAITAMFLFISIPMMETHILEKCPGYTAYQKKVSMLIPLPPKNMRQPV